MSTNLSLFGIGSTIYNLDISNFNKITNGIYTNLNKKISNQFCMTCNRVFLVCRASLIQVKEGVHSFEHESHIGIFFIVISLKMKKGKWSSIVELLILSIKKRQQHRDTTITNIISSTSIGIDLYYLIVSTESCLNRSR